MDFDATHALACGHIAQPAAVCQYDDCADEMCEGCTAICKECLDILCPKHQVRKDDIDHVYCQDDKGQYLVDLVT